MTIRDIAKLAGCSVATVSRVLNDADGVSEDMRRHVKQIIEENDFRPSSTAKSLAEKKTNTLLFVYENVPENPFYGELIRGAIEAAKQTHQILLFNIISEDYVIDYLFGALKSGQIDGTIIASTGNPETKQFARKMEQEHQKLVLINDPIDEMNVPRIYINNEQSAYQATKYLLRCGHRRIGHIGGRVTSFTSYNRYEGYCHAMNEAGLQRYTQMYLNNNNLGREDARRTALRLLQLPEPPTAIFAANDMMAIGVYEAAAELHLRIPDDLSVVGHDDINMASVMEPKLTTMHQPIFEMGRRAVYLLLDYIACNRPRALQESVVLAADLVERGSVRRL